MQIPAIIHQMWLSKTLTSKPRFDYSETVRNFHPHWEYNWWTLTRVRQLFRTIPALQKFLPTFETIQPWICKCDFSRYAILYVFGGCYIDLDYECLQPLDGLVQNQEWLFSKELDLKFLRREGTVNNGFLAVRAQHPFFLYVMERISENKDWFSIWHPFSPVSTVLHKTGPNVLYKYIQEFTQQYPTVAPPHFFNPCLVIPLKNTIWDLLAVYVFKMKIPERKHSCCQPIPSYLVCHTLEGSGWWTDHKKTPQERRSPLTLTLAARIHQILFPSTVSPKGSPPSLS